MQHGRTIFGLLIKTLFLCLVLTVMSPGVADAKLPKKSECSAEGQPPCPVIYKGRICDEGLGKFGNTCRKCGENGERACPKSAKGKPCFTGIKIDGRCYASCGGGGEKACPKIKSGYPCKGSYEPDSNGYCRSCGGDGQKACRALKAGKQCDSGLTKIDGSCHRCGGRGEKACPVLKAGKQCEGDLVNIGGVCNPCGARGQPACPVLKSGKQCDSNLTKINGTCQSCGGPNEWACPKIASGYPCRGSYEPDNGGRCRPCGGNGQPACRALKAGAQCTGDLKKIDGICQYCGGPDQKACPKLVAGFPCRGSFEPDNNGYCKPCGGVGETACRVLKAGRQCEVGSTGRGGVCVSCGGEGQRACKITDKGKPCEDGLKRGLNGICKITPAGATKRAALAQLGIIGRYIPEMIGAAFKVNGSSGINQQVEAGTLDAEEAVPVEKCPGAFRAMTAGGGGEIGFIFNVEGEGGWAWNCASGADRDVKMYSASSVNFRLGGGATVAGTLGFWVDDSNNLRGKSHGYVADIFDLLGTAQAVKGKDVSKMTKGLTDGIKGIKEHGLSGVPWEVSLGMWFERRDEDGDGDDDEVGRFLGFTVALGKSLGLDVGGAYIKAKTSQVCDDEMKCTEGTWEGRVGGGNGTIYIASERELSLMASINDGPLEEFTRRNKRKRDFTNSNEDRIRFRKNYTQLRYRPKDGAETRLLPVVPASIEGAWIGAFEDGGDPVGLIIQGQGEETLQVSVNNGEPKTYTRGRVFRRSYSHGSGGNKETLKFRKNFKLLKFEDFEGNEAELIPGNPDDVPTGPVGGTAAIAALGVWDFTVNGNALADEFIEQTGSFLVVRREGTEIERRYDKTGDNEYSTEFGGTFRFVSETRALWVSPDRKTVFQLNRR
ncbi:MAG: hypothetical protein WD767_15825 [Alphaproteobacteria bacterium]